MKISPVQSITLLPMKRTRSARQDDGRTFDRRDSAGHHQSEETAREEEGEKGSKQTRRTRRSPTKIQRILSRDDKEDSPMISTGNSSISQQVRETQVLQKKLFTWERMQRIAFELTKDIELYTPQRDPRDFNVLWRSYVRKLNQANEKVPSSVEPYSSDDERATLPVVDNVDGNVDISIVSGNSVDTVPEQEESSGPEVESLPDYDGEDEEFDLFMQTSLDERIMRLNVFLRSELYFCYYCGVQYKSEQDLFEHCPGITEDDHE